MNNTNLWAPWRISYLQSLEPIDSPDDKETCFLCEYWSAPENDQKNLVLWRTERCMVLFNRFPYSGGHILVAPADHIATMDQLTEATLLEMMCLTRDAQTVLTAAIKPHGFNVGMNIGHCAGAGLPDHLHLHLVPRWQGDTNFMAVNAHVRVISQALDELYSQLRDVSTQLNLPNLNPNVDE